MNITECTSPTEIHPSLPQYTHPNHWCTVGGMEPPWFGTASRPTTVEEPHMKSTIKLKPHL